MATETSIATGTENEHYSPECTFETILVPVDFSRYTPCVVKTALSFAKAFKSKLIFLNAATPGMYGTGAEPIPIEAFEVQLEAARAQMAELIASEPSIATFEHREIVEYATPVDLVHDLVKSEHVDLVIAGSHGASGLERLALGSIAESILRDVACPTLIVGPKCLAEEAPFRSVLFATDIFQTGMLAAKYAFSMTARFHSKLTLLRAIDLKKFPKESDPEELKESARFDLELLAPEGWEQDPSTSFAVEFGNAAEVICEKAMHASASLVVMGVRENKGLADHSPWSTLSHVIREVHCPVMCVRRLSA